MASPVVRSLPEPNRRPEAIVDQKPAPAVRRPANLGELRASGYRPRSVKAELRANLMARIAADEAVFPGIVGYDDSVLPAIENAIVAGHDIVFLGERGQAKTRLARSLVGLLDPFVPIVEGSELNEDPLLPILTATRERIALEGDETPLAWLPADRRYGEKLATPDITIADLIGEVDPIKVAEGRYLADESTIHYGLIPRTNRGIFTMNELPDLAERIQVGLLNILEERDVQVRGYTLRLPLDLMVVASANPEDYTSRGRIITPLKDRLGSQIRTHYPRTIEHELLIMDQERSSFDAADGPSIEEPAFMLEVVAELSHLARRAPEISQRSGVSVRVSVANLETLLASAIRRAVRLGEPSAAPRISDLGALIPSTVGKIELESAGEDASEERVVDRLMSRAIFNVFARRVDLERLAEVIDTFEAGLVVETGEHVPSRESVRLVRETPGLATPSAGWAWWSRRHRSPLPSSSCWKACTCIAVSTRTAARPVAAAATGDDRPGALCRRTCRRARGLRRGRRRQRADERPLYGGPYRYARWDGSQRLPDLSADEVLDALSDDLMAEGDLTEALRRLFERGLRRPEGALGDDVRGLNELLQRLTERRRELLQRYQLSDVLADVRHELEAIVETERRGIERRVGAVADPDAQDEALRRMAADMAARRQQQLDALPADPGERIRGLQEYDFLEPAARDRFEALLEKLRDQVLDSMFEGLSQAIRDATPEQLAANRDMVRDLNQLLSERLAGNEPAQDQVDAFLAQHGAFFPAARTLDDIV